MFCNSTIIRGMERSADSDSPNSKISRQSKRGTPHPSHTPHQSPNMALKQDQYLLDSPRPAPTCRFQNQRPTVLKDGMIGDQYMPHGFPIVTNLPTPAYSPVQEGPAKESPLAFKPLPNPQSYVNTNSSSHPYPNTDSSSHPYPNTDSSSHPYPNTDPNTHSYANFDGSLGTFFRNLFSVSRPLRMFRTCRRNSSPQR